MRTLIHIIFIGLLLLVTFFGIGPVLMADGILSERLITLAVIIGIYLILINLYRKILRNLK
ncbi:hypothetical protein E9840_10935 [Tissierella creatinini]|nr:hypothetical protein E9840_10935 [Tissierella creatinini]